MAGQRQTMWGLAILVGVAGLLGWYFAGDRTSKAATPSSLGSVRTDRNRVPPDLSTEPRPLSPITVETERPPPEVPAVATSQAWDAFAADPEALVLVGRVRTDSGDPVPGATVEVRRNHHGRAVEVVASTVSDEDGQFSIDGFVRVGETYALDASHRDYATARVFPLDPLVRRTFRQEVVLGAGSTLSGVVVASGTGVGVSGALVQVYDLERVLLSQEGILERSGECDGNGGFTLAGLSAGLKRVRVGHPQFATADLRRTVGKDAQDHMEVTLRPGDVIEGRVVDRDTGRGMPGVDVVAQPVISGSTPDVDPELSGVRTTSDGAGYFSLRGCRAGTQLVSASGFGASVNVETGDRKVVLEVGAMASVRGLVRDASTGQPVERFSVSWARGEFAIHRPHLTRCHSPTGEFYLPAVPPGWIHVVVEAPGYAPGFSEAQELLLGQEWGPVEVRLLPGTAITGRVVADEPMLAPCQIRLTEHRELPPSPRYPKSLPPRKVTVDRGFVTTHEDGSFILPNTGEGQYTLQVKGAGLVPFTTDMFWVPPGGERFDLGDLPVERLGYVTGTVESSKGARDHLALVTAVSLDGRSAADVIPASTDAEGRYRLGLAPGAWRVVIAMSEGVPVPSLDDQAGQVIQVSSTHDSVVNLRAPQKESGN